MKAQNELMEDKYLEEAFALGVKDGEKNRVSNRYLSSDGELWAKCSEAWLNGFKLGSK